MKCYSVKNSLHLNDVTLIKQKGKPKVIFFILFMGAF